MPIPYGGEPDRRKVHELSVYTNHRWNNLVGYMSHIVNPSPLTSYNTRLSNKLIFTTSYVSGSQIKLN